MNKLQFIKSTLLIALGVVLLGSCMKDNGPDQEPTPVAVITFFNAYSPVSEVGLRLGAQALGTLKYGEVNGGAWSVLGTQKLTFLNPTGSTIIAERDVNMVENKYYTALVYGKGEGNRNFIFTEDVAIESSEAFPRVRFFNLANDAGEVDVFIGEDGVDAIFENRAQETQAGVSNSQKFILSNKSGAAKITAKNAAGEVVATTDGPYSFTSKGSNGHYSIALVGDPAQGDGENDKSTYKIIVF